MGCLEVAGTACGRTWVPSGRKMAAGPTLDPHPVPTLRGDLALSAALGRLDGEGGQEGPWESSNWGCGACARGAIVRGRLSLLSPVKP